jgi:hypothetical protein
MGLPYPGTGLATKVGEATLRNLLCLQQILGLCSNILTSMYESIVNGVYLIKIRDLEKGKRKEYFVQRTLTRVMNAGFASPSACQYLSVLCIREEGYPTFIHPS